MYLDRPRYTFRLEPSLDQIFCTWNQKRTLSKEKNNWKKKLRKRTKIKNTCSDKVLPAFSAIACKVHHSYITDQNELFRTPFFCLFFNHFLYFPIILILKLVKSKFPGCLLPSSDLTTDWVITWVLDLPRTNQKDEKGTLTTLYNGFQSEISGLLKQQKSTFYVHIAQGFKDLTSLVVFTCPPLQFSVFHHSHYRRARNSVKS